MEKGIIKIESFLKEFLNCRENISFINVYCNLWVRCSVILVLEVVNGCLRVMVLLFMLVMLLFKFNFFFIVRYCGVNVLLI